MDAGEGSGGVGVAPPSALLAHPFAASIETLQAALVESVGIDPADLLGAIGWAVALALVGVVSKFLTGWYAAGRLGVGPKGRMRAGTTLIARGEFSIVIAAFGAELVDGPELGALAAGYVPITAIAGPLLAKFSDRLPTPPVPQSKRAAPAT